MDPRQAKACAAQLYAAANAGEPVTRPDLNAALADLEVRLTERMSAQFRWLVGVIVAVAGLAVAAAKYLP